MIDPKRAAWQGRADLVDISTAQAYSLRNVTGENPKPVSIRKPDHTAAFTLAVIISALFVLLWL